MRIAVIDHSYHTKTRSSDFFYDLLSEIGSVTRYDCSHWAGGNRLSASALGIKPDDIVVFWQQIYPPRFLRTFGYQTRPILVPMYDNVVNWKPKKWRKFRAFPIISFSRQLHDVVTAEGCQSFPVRYFPDSSSQVAGPSTNGRKGWTVFFWERQAAISWRLVRQLLAGVPIRQVLYKPSPDPGWSTDPIPEDDLRRFNVRHVGWLPSKEESLKLVHASDIFIAPRMFEGIGMAFLEAMAAGKLVIAPNHGTMNEYIVHGYNGLLYDPSNPKPILMNVDVPAITRQAATDAAHYLRNWRTDRKALLEWLRQRFTPTSRCDDNQ